MLSFIFTKWLQDLYLERNEPCKSLKWALKRCKTHLAWVHALLHELHHSFHQPRTCLEDSRLQAPPFIGPKHYLKDLFRMDSSIFHADYHDLSRIISIYMIQDLPTSLFKKLQVASASCRCPRRPRSTTSPAWSSRRPLSAARSTCFAPCGPSGRPAGRANRAPRPRRRPSGGEDVERAEPRIC